MNLYIEGGDNILKSYMNRRDDHIREDLLAQLFHLNNCGKVISGQEITRKAPKGPAILANIEEMD